MTIRARLKISTVISVVTLIVVGAVLFDASSRADRISRKRQVIFSLAKGISDLEILVYDYLLYHERRAEEQWRAKYDELQELPVKHEFRDQEALIIIMNIEDNLKNIKNIFFRLVANSDSTGRIVEPSGEIFSELDKRLMEQMALRSRETAAYVFRLNEFSHEKAMDIHRRSSIMTVIFVVALTAVVSATSIMINKKISNPIKMLQKGTEIIGSGNLDYRVNINTNDEIGKLSASIDQMTARLKKISVSRDELVKENMKRKHAENALKASNRELEAFSYSVSHDLRAPLRSIDGFSRALLEDYAGKLDGKGKDHLERVCRASRRMGQLIDDMLKLSRISRAEMRYEKIDLSNMAREVCSELQNRRPERNVEFIIHEGLIVNGDASLLRIAVENLLGNAWKFTANNAQARIEFGGVSTNGKKEFFVRDNGAGFDMAYVNKLFQPFQRLHEMNEFKGTGIGLANVRRVIQRHGGDIWAEGAKGKGATFYFSI